MNRNNIQNIFPGLRVSVNSAQNTENGSTMLHTLVSKGIRSVKKSTKLGSDIVRTKIQNITC